MSNEPILDVCTYAELDPVAKIILFITNPSVTVKLMANSNEGPSHPRINNDNCRIDLSYPEDQSVPADTFKQWLKRQKIDGLQQSCTFSFSPLQWEQLTEILAPHIRLPHTYVYPHTEDEKVDQWIKEDTEQLEQEPLLILPGEVSVNSELRRPHAGKNLATLLHNKTHYGTSASLSAAPLQTVNQVQKHFAEYSLFSGSFYNGSKELQEAFLSKLASVESSHLGVALIFNPLTPEETKALKEILQKINPSLTLLTEEDHPEYQFVELSMYLAQAVNFLTDNAFSNIPNQGIHTTKKYVVEIRENEKSCCTIL